MSEPQGTSPVSSDDKLWAGFSYAGWLFCLLPTVAIFLFKKDVSQTIRFHSLQALGLGLAVMIVGIGLNIVTMVLSLIPFLGLVTIPVSLLFSVAVLGYWVYLMVQAFSGHSIEVPYLGDFIRNNLME